ncbi:uncharacterized protein LOC124286386 [Haliotis rubra]|uniref:uncharacterized protein LOC124286386 n=1 Tax=Haliotis rubra TaxID=36100 RepID=UPI001EE5BF9F|nr:uncharacterized protein LOC124286386 [Haliotis rubra]
MMNPRHVVIVLLLWAIPQVVFTRSQRFRRDTRTNIKRVADSYIGRTRWSYASSHATGSNTNKCNIFVADVIEEAGGSVPHRWWGFAGPIGAREWGNPSSSFLTRDGCWTNHQTGREGDVIAGGGHVGIVTGGRLTTSAARYSVVKNNWGYRSGQSVTFWRYTC